MMPKQYPKSEFLKLKEELEARKCKPCRGLGFEDDACEGDIMFNTWTCRTCEGTGLNG